MFNQNARKACARACKHASEMPRPSPTKQVAQTSNNNPLQKAYARVSDRWRYYPFQIQRNPASRARGLSTCTECVCAMQVVAHRLSTVENADLIVVLNEGTVLEMGTHAELMSKGERYAELVSKQSLK